MSVLTGWMWADNLRPCLELLAGVGETELDAGTWDAFEAGLTGTDLSADRWFQAPLGKLTVALARGEGGQISTRVEAPHGFGRAVEAVTRACATYRLEART